MGVTGEPFQANVEIAIPEPGGKCRKVSKVLKISVDKQIDEIAQEVGDSIGVSLGRWTLVEKGDPGGNHRLESYNLHLFVKNIFRDRRVDQCATRNWAVTSTSQWRDHAKDYPLDHNKICVKFAELCTAKLDQAYELVQTIAANGGPTEAAPVERESSDQKPTEEEQQQQQQAKQGLEGEESSNA